MPLPPLIRQLADQLLTDFCAQHSPPHLGDKLRIEFAVAGNKVTITEHRPHFMDPAKWTVTKVAVLDYDADDGTWELGCFDRNSRRVPYRTEPTSDLAALLKEVDEDPTGIFWG
jgi:hypothetical protein